MIDGAPIEPSSRDERSAIARGEPCVSRERGAPRPVWGVSHRTNATVLQWWPPRASLRVCRPRGEDAQAERWLRAFHLWPARVVERRATLDVLQPSAPGAP